MALLAVNDLRLSLKSAYGPKEVLKGINFSLEPGESLAIVGESGSGKTVTSLMAMGLIPGKIIASKSGSMTYHAGFDTELLFASENTIRLLRGKEIAMIFQEPMTALNPSYTCGKQLFESIRIHGQFPKAGLREKAESLLKEVGLHDSGRILGSYPHQLSGGQRQRIMIAMALAGDPRLLIADEPTTALDVSVQAAVLQLLRDLQRSRQMALIFISHDLALVKQIADKVLVLYRGMQLEYGKASEVFSNPSHPYTKALLYCRPAGRNRDEFLPTVQEIMDYKDDEFKEKRFSPEKIHKPAPSENVFVEIDKLAVSYSSGSGLFSKKTENTVVHSASFAVYKGETLGLLGESGSGKTTIGRAILKLTPYQKGEIRFPELPHSKKSFSRIAQIIFQDPLAALNPRMRVIDAIEEPMIVHGLHGKSSERKQKAAALLREVGLDEQHFYAWPHELSGGQRQRVCIARCLSVEPELIVCDESVAALDVSIQAQVINLLKRLQITRGLTYLFISHDLSVVRYFCDRVIVLQQGKIVESGETEALFSKPQHPYTRQLIANSPA